MTIDEAIENYQHFVNICKHAEEQELDISICITKEFMILNRQTVEWLKELKRFRDNQIEEAKALIGEDGDDGREETV